MPSTPLIASSSGVATVSAMTFGLAPGYTVRTTTEGGTTSGYSPIGSNGIAINPAAKITIESTAAKIGRSMKNFEKSIWVTCSGVACSSRQRPCLVYPCVATRRSARVAVRGVGLRLRGCDAHPVRRRVAHRDRLRRNGHTGEEHLLHAVHDHEVAEVEPVIDDAQV